MARGGMRLSTLNILLRVQFTTAFAILAAIYGAVPAASAESRKSGYAIGVDRCGSGALSFPAIRIDMKKGFCAGLVASEADNLKLPA